MQQYLFGVVCTSLVDGNVFIRRSGWLEKAASYYRTKFLDDVEKTAPVELKVSLLRNSPPGIKLESEKWDYESVDRLLRLLGADERAGDVRQALRTALQSSPARRVLSVSKNRSWKLFPSLGVSHPNEIYYDFDHKSSEEAQVRVPGYGHLLYDNAVLVLQNPVEARLPSSMISIKLLREILEARALAARHMPETTKSTIPWMSMNMTGTTVTANANNTNMSDAAGADGAVFTTDTLNAATINTAEGGERTEPATEGKELTESNVERRFRGKEHKFDSRIPKN